MAKAALKAWVKDWGRLEEIAKRDKKYYTPRCFYHVNPYNRRDRK